MKLNLSIKIKKELHMLKKEDIQLNLLEKKDLYLLVKWRNESYENFYEYPFSNYKQGIWFEEYIKSGDLVFIIYKRDSYKTIMGSVGLSKIDNRNKNAEFGRFLIDKKFRGKGFGKKAIFIILDYAFNHLNLHSIYLDTFKSNIKIIDFYEKVGFKQEGIKREHIYKNGKYNDLVNMRILKMEYK